MVDAGRAKEKVLDSHGAAARFQIAWISKASAEQRAGRAGRTGPGHCYRWCPRNAVLLERIIDHPTSQRGLLLLWCHGAPQKRHRLATQKARACLSGMILTEDSYAIIDCFRVGCTQPGGMV